jgi:hypothetical protein
MDTEQFLATLADEILDPAEYGDTSRVSERLRHLDDAISRLETLKTQADYEWFVADPEGSNLAR